MGSMTDKFKGKKVLVFGLGLNDGGVGTVKFFAKHGAKIRVTDLRGVKILKPSLNKLKKFNNISYTLGKHKYEDIDWADLIIKNPAVKPGNKYISYALKKGKRVEQEMGIFLDFVRPSQIIGVTGTKGKSTTASLIYEVLSRGVALLPPPRWKPILAGNIGKSVLGIISRIKPNTLVVLELSSFQLESFELHKTSPKWAVITNITPDHLNYYRNMHEYIEAKKAIVKYQTKNDFLFIRKGDPIVEKQNFLKNFKGKIIYFSKDDLPKKLHPILKGEHNLENISAAFRVGKEFELNNKKILDELAKFRGIPFRMEYVKRWHGVKIINDTAATSPESATKALQTHPGAFLICGGMNKGIKYQTFAKAIEKNAKKVFFLIGDSTDEIKKLMKKKNLIAGTYDNLEKLLKDIKKQVKKGDTILFSPAATSFNLFKNEFDRGRKFNLAVKKIFK